MRIALLMLLLACANLARAAIVFTPHVSEYEQLPRGLYIDSSIDYSSITKTWDADGRRVANGNGAIAPGASIDAAQLLSRWLWIGNLFEDTRVPFLASHDQVFRVIGTAGTQRGSGAIQELSRQFGQHTNSAGIGDLFLLAGIYGDRHHWGPLHANELYAVTVKAPIGEYDRHSLLNIGSHYWTVAPQLSQHQNWFGRLSLDATTALQLNGSNGTPAYGGLTPTRPADVWNVEANLAWKFTEHWYAEGGFSWYRSLGANRYGKLSLNVQDQPVPPTTACTLLGIPSTACGLLRAFYLAPVPGEYRDRGIENGIATAGFSYVYRTSAVLSLRAALPLFGRGAQFDANYYSCATPDCNARTQIPGAGQTARLSGVQEAAAISASPYFELRLVYLPFAP